MAFTNDLGLNPPTRGNIHSRTCTAAATGITFGMIVVKSGDDHDSVAACTATGTTGVYGIVTSQGDPNSSGQFAVGDPFSVRDAGDAQVLVLAGTAYDKTDMIITSGTLGVGKKRESETGIIDVVGYPVQKVTTGTNNQLIAVRLNLHKISL